MGKVTKSMITSFSKFKSEWEKDAGMTVVVSKRNSMESGSSPSGLKLGKSAKYYIGQFKNNKNIARSYVGGTNTNSYKYSKSSLTMTVVRKEKQAKGLKFFIHSDGKDNPTPVYLRENSSGQWKLTNYSSICTGVKKTVEEEGDF